LQKFKHLHENEIIMLVSATYISPDRGIIDMEPPESVRLRQSAQVAWSIGIQRLLLPVLEESLFQSTRRKVHYLDGLIRALDQVWEARLDACLIAPAQRILGLNFVPPHMAAGFRNPAANPVFVDGKIRNLLPFNWWADPSIIQKRIKAFREVLTAVKGHPAITGWLIMDRALEWARPKLEVADLVLKSCFAEIRERDEKGAIYLGLGWSELLDPEMSQPLAAQVDGLRISGLDRPLPGLEKPQNLATELFIISYLGTLAQWLYRRPIDVEIGWGLLDNQNDTEEIVEAGKRLAGQGLTGVNWISLIDPEPKLYKQPPWVLKSGLDSVGLLNHGMEPKEYVENLLGEFHSCKPEEKVEDFIDISLDEYRSDPDTHLPRLWEHFQESHGA
jgi:hypothetical protein